MMELKNLKKVCGETKSLGRRNGEYLQLNIDMETGELFTNYHVSLGQNSWSQYNDSNIKVIGNISSPMTMAEIKEMVVRNI